MLDSRAKAARELFAAIQDELDNKDDGFKEGLTFLDLKNDTLLSYMIDVCNIILRKVKTETIENHNSVDRCVEYRVILEKIKCIDQRLAYQLNKLITLPEDAVEESEKIDINNLDIDLDAEDADEPDSDENESNSSNDEPDSSNDDSSSPKRDQPGPLYKPPKLRSVAYSEERRKDYSGFYQEEEQQERAPEDDERTRYEEDNYTRLPKKKLLKAKEPARKRYRKSRGGSRR